MVLIHWMGNFARELRFAPIYFSKLLSPNVGGKERRDREKEKMGTGLAAIRKTFRKDASKVDWRKDTPEVWNPRLFRVGLYRDDNSRRV